MVLDQQDLRRVTNINTYEATCWPSFVLEIFYVFSDGVTRYTCDCTMYIAKGYVFWQQKVGGTKDIIFPHPTSKSPPRLPFKLAPCFGNFF